MSGSPVLARRVLKSPPRTAVRPASNCSSPDLSSRGPDWTISVTKRSHQRRWRAARRVRHRTAISTDGRPDVTIMGRTCFFPQCQARKAPGDTVPGDTWPGDTVPGDTVPGDTVPGDTVPGDTVPGDTVPGDTVPGDT